jgi:hypothetical protein
MLRNNIFLRDARKRKMHKPLTAKYKSAPFQFAGVLDILFQTCSKVRENIRISKDNVAICCPWRVKTNQSINEKEN